MDWINANKPAKLLGFQSLTLKSGSSRFGPVYLYLTPTFVIVMREIRSVQPITKILRDYPQLERDDIRAAIAYAAQQTDHVVLKTA